MIVTTKAVSQGKTNAKDWPSEYICNILESGLVDYSDAGAGRAMLTKETILKILPSFVGKPVTIDHIDLTPDSYADHAVGIITRVWWDDVIQWAMCAFILTDDKAKENVAKGYSVSCAYDGVQTINCKGAQWHAIPYDEEIVNGIGNHLALVTNPRYEGAKIMPSSPALLMNQPCMMLVNSKRAVITEGEGKKDNRSLTKEEIEQMKADAKVMGQDEWCRKYPIGDYQQYRENAKKVCPECNGSGQDEADPSEECVACGGSGRWEDYKMSNSFQNSEEDIEYSVMTGDSEFHGMYKSKAEAEEAKKELEKKPRYEGTVLKVVKAKNAKSDYTVTRRSDGTVKRVEWIGKDGHPGGFDYGAGKEDQKDAKALIGTLEHKMNSAVVKMANAKGYCGNCGSMESLEKKMGPNGEEPGWYCSECGAKVNKPSVENAGTDNPKIDIFVDGKYEATTTWAKTCKEAVTRFIEKEKPEGKVTASFQNSVVVKVANSDKRTVARWETSGRKTWVELYCDAMGYTYSSSNGGGNLGAFDSDAAAIAKLEQGSLQYTKMDHPSLKRVNSIMVKVHNADNVDLKVQQTSKDFWSLIGVSQKHGGNGAGAILFKTRDEAITKGRELEKKSKEEPRPYKLVSIENSSQNSVMTKNASLRIDYLSGKESDYKYEVYGKGGAGGSGVLASFKTKKEAQDYIDHNKEEFMKQKGNSVVVKVANGMFNLGNGYTLETERTPRTEGSAGVKGTVYKEGKQMFVTDKYPNVDDVIKEAKQRIK